MRDNDRFPIWLSTPRNSNKLKCQRVSISPEFEKYTFNGHVAFIDIMGIGLSSKSKESKLGASTIIVFKPLALQTCKKS